MAKQKLSKVEEMFLFLVGIAIAFAFLWLLYAGFLWVVKTVTTTPPPWLNELSYWQFCIAYLTGRLTFWLMSPKK